MKAKSRRGPIRFRILGGAALTVLILLAADCSNKGATEGAPVQSSPAKAAGESTTGWKLDLKVSPERPRMVRPATLTVHIVDSAGKPVENAEVTGSLNMMLMDMGKNEVKFESKGNGDYEAEVPGFDMSGPWSLVIEAVKGDARAGKAFQVNVFD